MPVTQCTAASSHNMYSLVHMHRDSWEDIYVERRGDNFTLGSRQDFGHSVICVFLLYHFVSVLNSFSFSYIIFFTKDIYL